MSKIYEALQRLEWERAEYHAGKQGTRPAEKGTRSAEERTRPAEAWWAGVLVGCVLGFALGIVAVAVTSDRRLRFSAPETPAVAHALPPAVAHALPPAVARALPSPEEPLTPPTPPTIVVEAPPIEPEPLATEPYPAPFAVQVGTFRNRDNAARLAEQLGAAAYRVTIEPSASDNTLWVVRIGDYPDRAQAEAARAGLEDQGMSGLLVSRSLERSVEAASRHAGAPEGN